MKEGGRDRQYQALSNRVAGSLPVLEALHMAAAIGLDATSRRRVVAQEVVGKRYRENYAPCERCGKKRSRVASYCQHCGALGKVKP